MADAHVGPARGDAPPLGARHPRLRRCRDRELAASYDVDEVMVHPVAGAFIGTPADTSPARETTLSPARRRARPERRAVVRDVAAVARSNHVWRDASGSRLSSGLIRGRARSGAARPRA